MLGILPSSVARLQVRHPPQIGWSLVPARKREEAMLLCPFSYPVRPSNGATFPCFDLEKPTNSHRLRFGEVQGRMV